MSDHLPTEIIIEILTRLPVKSLLRFTLVCKLWYSIIRNPNFITTHLNRFAKTTTNQLLLRFYTNNDRKEHYLLLPDDKKFDENYVELDFPFNSTIGYFRIVGSCNGLICLCDDYFQDAENVILWNPCLRKSVTLALPEKPQNPYMCVIGFGFDLSKNVFKVVRIIYEKECLNQLRVPPNVEVYEQGGGEWRGIGCAPPQYFIVEFMWSQVFVHDAVHWVAYNPSVAGGFHNLIIAFEMRYDMFREIELPPVVADQRPTCLSVTLFKDSLAVLCGGQSGSGACSVWVMRDYGVFETWTKLYNITLPDFLSRTLGFRKNGEILITSDTGELISYDSATKTMTNTIIQGSSYSLKVLSFVESLVLLEGENDVPDLLHNFF